MSLVPFIDGGPWTLKPEKQLLSATGFNDSLGYTGAGMIGNISQKRVNINKRR